MQLRGPYNKKVEKYFNVNWIIEKMLLEKYV